MGQTVRRVLLLVLVLHLVVARAVSQAAFAFLIRSSCSGRPSDLHPDERASAEELHVSVSVSLEMAQDHLVKELAKLARARA